ncbi:MAG: hypothetical protein AABX17_02090 [Nanoarchaeota archaeon]
MILKNKKSSMHISIVLFVIFTLVLAMTSIVAFNIKKNTVDSKINSGVEIQKVYSRAEIVEFYLREVSSKADSAESFRATFDKLKNSDGNYIMPEFLEIEKMIDSKHIVVEDKHLKIALDVNVSVSSDLYRENYLYQFRYEGILS